MNLQDGVLAVRTKLGELQPYFWSDTEIVEALNESAQRMCSAAQFLNGFATFNTAQIVMPDKTVQFAQEYALPKDVDQITGASFFSGTLFPLQPTTREAVQVGGKVGGIPFYFYIRKQSRTFTQQTNSGNIQTYQLPPNDGGDSVTIIGLYPIPTGVAPVYIHYTQWHPYLQNPQDEVQIPPRFKQGWIAWAIARMKEKESAFDEATYFDNQHEKYTQDFVDWNITNGNEISPPEFTSSRNRGLMRGASTVLVVAQNPGTTNL